MAKRRKTHTLTITVTAPAWLSRRDLKREVRFLINDSAPWGTERIEDGHRTFDTIDHGDIKARKVG